MFLSMTGCANIIKIRCVFYHFIIGFGDTVTYNDIPYGVISGNITSSFVGSQLWD